MEIWLIIVLILLALGLGVLAYLHFSGKLPMSNMLSSTSSVVPPAN